MTTSTPPVPIQHERTWWFDARGLRDGQQAIWEHVNKNGSRCAAILVTLDQLNKPTSLRRIVWIETPEQLERIAKGDGVMSPSEEVVRKARDAGISAGVFIEVPDLEGQFPRCLELVERGYDFLAIDMHHATYIPFEQLVVRVKDLARRTALKKTQLLRWVPIRQLQGVVTDVYQSMNAFATLEFGVDVLLGVHDLEAIKGIDQRIGLCEAAKMDLVPGEVIGIDHTLMGDRVCIDTTSRMTADEGMIIGATGWGGVFVCSETHHLPHMNLREFRVNAGALSCYVWGPDDRAYYLSEQKAGSEVLATDTKGNTRALTVCRVKIERRPLLLIVCKAKYRYPHEAEPRDVIIKTFVQNDWHVRIMGADGKVRNSSLVKKGDFLLVHPDWPGRHMGEKVDETILEK